MVGGAAIVGKALLKWVRIQAPHASGDLLAKLLHLAQENVQFGLYVVERHRLVVMVLRPTDGPPLNHVRPASRINTSMNDEAARVGTRNSHGGAIV
jgi:hypothetical protein